MARLLFLTALLAWQQVVLAQDPPRVNPESVPPQVVIIVRKHALGPDLVDVTVSAKDYPLALLEQQCRAMAAGLGSDARGLSVVRSGFDPKIKFAKASFATDGIIDRDKGEVKLAKLVRNFLGAPSEWRLSSFLVTLDGEVPVEKQTLKEFSSDAVVLRANVSHSPRGIEYRILALTQDPEKFDIPVRHKEPVVKEQKPPSDPSSLPSWVPIALVAVAGLAAGLLVYSALSGRSPRPNGRTDQRT